MQQGVVGSLPVESVQGVDSWLLASRHVDAALTQIGGHLGPVTFKLAGKKVQPYSVAPWAQEPLDPATPSCLRVLRGDFFCAPFGGNALAYNQEKHPVHGESANGLWKLSGVFQDARELAASFSMSTSIRPGQISKMIRLVSGHTCVYTRHTLNGFSGPMPLGHHAMLKFPDEPMSGYVSTSCFCHGQVLPTAFENAAQKGYQALKAGATFKSLHQVATLDGTLTDLTHYPARPGFEDLVMIVSSPRQKLAWSAVTFPREGYAWFALKDPRVLHNTVFWISNGGRHYAPWNSRHTRVLGIEEVTAYFHYGLAESAGANPLSRDGMPTAIELKPDAPTTVNYIAGVVAIPHGFDRVQTLRPGEDGKSVTLVSSAGHEAQAPVDVDFLYGKQAAVGACRAT